MLNRTTLLIIALLFALGSPKSIGAHDPRLAKMIEQAIAETGFSISITVIQDTAVRIDKINRKNLCALGEAENVRKLQEAFNRQPDIEYNFGPQLMSVTKNGRVYIEERQTLGDRGFPINGFHCVIYISVPE